MTSWLANWAGNLEPVRTWPLGSFSARASQEEEVEELDGECSDSAASELGDTDAGLSARARRCRKHLLHLAAYDGTS